MELIATLVTGLVAVAGGSAFVNVRKLSSGARMKKTVADASAMLEDVTLTSVEREAIVAARQVTVFRWAALNSVKIRSYQYFVILFGFLATTMLVSKVEALNPFANDNSGSVWAASYPAMTGVAVSAGIAIAAVQFLLFERERNVRQSVTHLEHADAEVPADFHQPRVSFSPTHE